MNLGIKQVAADTRPDLRLSRNFRIFFLAMALCAFAAPAALIYLATGAPKLSELKELGALIHFLYLVFAFIFASGFLILGFLPQQRAEQKTLAIIAMVCLLLPFSIYGIFTLQALPHASLASQLLSVGFFAALLFMFISTAMAMVFAFKIAFPNKSSKAETI